MAAQIKIKPIKSKSPLTVHCLDCGKKILDIPQGSSLIVKGGKNK